MPVGQIASIVAEGELLYLTSTGKNERHTITYRLKDLEARLDPARFIRLGRGTLANIDLITKVNVMPGGTHVALLTNGQKLQVSRLQSRIIREKAAASLTAVRLTTLPNYRVLTGASVHRPRPAIH